MKSKTRTYVDKVYTNFRGLNVPENDTKCESFTVSSLLVYENKYYVQVYLDDCAFEIVDKETHCLDDNPFETEKN